MLLKPFTIALTTVSLATLVAGCAASRPASLDRARASLLQVQQDPVVVQNAPSHLSDAQATLASAEREWTNNGDGEEASHLAYVSEQKAGIAVAVAQQEAAEIEAQQLVAQRDDIRLAARSREAVRAREQALVATTRAQSLEQELAALKARETERGLVMTLEENVLFEYDKADLKPGAVRNLYPLVTFLKEHPHRTLMIEGHTDSTGSDSYNLDLSQQRAAAVRNFLIMNGIGSDRVMARGYGEAYPVTTNDTESGRLQNRRVEVVISHEGQQVAER
jgi:outer membrane protein OmpA-like peptidoglycan-associated protein